MDHKPYTEKLSSPRLQGGCGSNMPDMANAHELLISQSEAQLLAGVIGCRLERIRFDRWSASLEFDSCVLVAHPEPGCGGSPMFPNKEEIMRLLVRPAKPEESARQDSSPSNQFNLRERVRDIHILHSLVMFSEPVEAGAQKLGPIQLPPGPGYDVGCINPSRVAREHFEQLVRRGCANLVDIGIVISQEDSSLVVIRTDGCNWAVFLTSGGDGSVHQEIATMVALGDRGARPLSR